MQPTSTAQSTARIIDRGYQHYDGARLGLAHAIRVMMLAALRRGMGIKRSARAKVLPWILTLAAYLPVVAILGLRVILGGAGSAPTPGYDVLYGGFTTVYILFAGLVAPDLLCADRRERVLSLLFAAPITRLAYVGAEYAAMSLLLSLLTLVPLLVLFGGNALLAPAAGAYVQSHLDDLWYVLVTGSLLALFYAAVASAVSAFTDRRAYASGAFLGLMLVSTIAVGILIQTVHLKGHEWLQVFLLVSLPLRTGDVLFGRLSDDPTSKWAYLAVCLGAIIGSLVLLIWRYVRIRE